jgi:hypothetical protein
MTTFAKAFQPHEVEKFMSNLPSFTSEEILQVSKTTIGQADAALWHKVREGRITASRQVHL